MGLNESTIKRRARWPLEFDLEGIPREDRARALAARQQPSCNDPELAYRGEDTMPPVTNMFAVDQPQQGAIVDINNPPRKNYNPHDPKNEFPKMLYHHESGHVLVVKSAKEERLATARGFQLKPAPGRDYSKVRSGMVAPPLPEAAPRDHGLTAEELDLLDPDNGEDITGEFDEAEGAQKPPRSKGRNPKKAR